MLDLTICSTSYDSCDYINLNASLMIPKGVDWLVALNKQKERVSSFVRSIPGVPSPTEVPEGFVGRASYHHAAALNMICRTQELKTRYVLFLDPDFFIMPDMGDIIKYMEEKDLTFFGAPYYLDEGKIPRVYDFPVAYCMFVDTHKVAAHSLDFEPAPYKDTGYKIYEKYKFSDHKYEAVLPYNPNKHGLIGTTQKSVQSEYGYVPQSKMDQFFWQDKLFGVHCHAKLHLRGEAEIKARAKAHIADIKNIVELARGGK